MTEREEIIERYRRLREDPMTPQYLTGMGQSGSLLDYQETEELGELACRDGHQGLASEHDGYRFCTRCGHRVCAVCGRDIGSLIVSWQEHRATHADE